MVKSSSLGIFYKVIGLYSDKDLSFMALGLYMSLFVFDFGHYLICV